MAVKFSNNAKTLLSSGITSTATSIAVDDASSWPQLYTGDYSLATIVDINDNTILEIVKVTAISNNTLTVVRAQEGTSARAFDSGDRVELRVTAGLLEQALTGTDVVKLDSITATTTDAYSLAVGGVAYSPSNANALIVSLNGVTQEPNSAFTVSGSTITFASALTANDSIDYIVDMAKTLDIGEPSDNTVTPDKLTSAVNLDAITDNGNTTTNQIGIKNAGSTLTASLSVDGTNGAEAIRIGSATGGGGAVQGESYIGLTAFSAGTNQTYPHAWIGVEEFDAADSRGSLILGTRQSDSDVAPTTVMTLDESGNVGINVTDPDERLEVAGDIKSSTGGNAGVYHFGGTSDQTKIVGRDTSHPTLPDTMDFYTGGSFNMRLNSNGDLGIGSAPVSTLSVAKDDRVSGPTISISNTISDSSWASGDVIGRLDFRSEDPSTTEPVRGRIESLYTNTGGGTYPSYSGLSFKVAAVNTLSEAMLIDGYGNVGIGTSSPINVSSLYKGLTIDGTGAGGGIVHFSTDDAENARLISTPSLTRLATTGSTPIEFGTGGTGISQVKMKMDANGRFLINKASATSALNLEVQAPSGFSVGSGFHSASTQSTIEFKDANTTANYKVRIGSEGDDLLLFAGTDVRMRIDSSGKVGIGTSPAYPFHVDKQSGGIVGFFEAPTGVLSRTIFKGPDAACQTDVAFYQGSNLQGVIGASLTTGDLFLDSRSSAGGNIIFQRSGSERMRITAGGYVGINEESPDSLLHIKSTAPDIILEDSNSSSAIGSSNRVRFRNSSGTYSAQIGNDPSINSGLNFTLGTLVGYGVSIIANGAERLSIDTGGRHTITHNTYSYAAANYFIKSTTSAGNAYMGNVNGMLTMSSNGYYYGGALRKLDAGKTSLSELQIRTDGAFSFNRVTGATAGSTVSTVASMVIDASANLLVNKSTVNVTVTGFEAHNTGSCFASISSSTNNTYHYYNTSNSQYRFYVKNNGGIANFSGNNVNLSDQRTKKDIVDSGDYLSKLCQIPVRNFRYNHEEDDGKHHLGVISQEVEAVAPELVEKDAYALDDGITRDAVYTQDLNFAMLKAIQELSAQVDELKAEVAALKGA